MSLFSSIEPLYSQTYTLDKNHNLKRCRPQGLSTHRNTQLDWLLLFHFITQPILLTVRRDHGGPVG